MEQYLHVLDFVGAELVVYDRPNHVVALHFVVEVRPNFFCERGCLDVRLSALTFVTQQVTQYTYPTSMSLTTLGQAIQRSNIIPQCRRKFSTTQFRPDFHFDTHHFVQRLEREGLNRAQAEGIMSAMAEVIDESIRNMTSNMVTKADQEKVSVQSGRLCSLARC